MKNKVIPIGARVLIDGIEGVVTAHTKFMDGTIQFRIQYFANGDIKEIWIDPDKFAAFGGEQRSDGNPKLGFH